MSIVFKPGILSYCGVNSFVKNELEWKPVLEVILLVIVLLGCLKVVFAFNNPIYNFDEVEFRRY